MFVVVIIGVGDVLPWSIGLDLGVVGLLVVGAGVDGTGMRLGLFVVLMKRPWVLRGGSWRLAPGMQC